MTPDEMREGAAEFYERAFNQKDLDWIRDSIADDFVEHQQMPGLTPDKEGALAFFGMMFASVPDMKAEILDTVVSGNKIAIRSRTSGTQTGEMMGMPATGKSFSVEAIDIVEVTDDGKTRSHAGVTDAMGMMMQLGLVPSPE